MSNKGVVLVAAVVVVAGVAIAAMNGWLPPKKGAEGTIGAASRYQSPQIADADVAIADQKVQAFLQSDIYTKMASDATFRKFVLSNSAELLGKFYAKSKAAKDGADLSELLDGAEVAALMNDAELLNAVSGEEAFKKAVLEHEVVEMAKSAKTKSTKSAETSLAPPRFDAAQLARVRKVLQEAGVSEAEKKAKLWEDAGWVELVAERKATSLLESPEVLEMLSDAGLAELFHDEDLQNVLMDSSVMEALEHAPVEALRKGVVRNP